MHATALFLALAVAAVSASYDPKWRTGLNGETAVPNNNAENCIIFSEIGKMYSEIAARKNWTQLNETHWVLSFRMQYISQSEGGTAANRFKFEKGAAAIIHQMERKSQNPTKFEELAQKYQKWKLTSEGNIITHYNAHALSVADANLNPGAEVVMWPTHPGSNLKWVFDENRRICSAMPDSNVCLELVADLRDGSSLRIRTAAPTTVGGKVPRIQQWFIMCEPASLA